MTRKIDNPDVDIAYMQEIQKKCLELWHSSGTERGNLDREETALAEERAQNDPSLIEPSGGITMEYSVLGNFLDYDAFLAGYLHQLTTRRSIRNVQQAHLRLKHAKLLVRKGIPDWYFADNEYHILKQLMQCLDYFRLLLIQYIETYLLDEEHEETGI